jgi:hypothetical protein
VRFIVIRDVPSFVQTNVVPDDFALGANYPNPFNPTTTIPFSVPVVSHVAIQVYNVQGQKVRTLLNDQMQPGNHIVVFDMKDDAGMALPSGVYFYRMTTDGFAAKKRLLFLK